jgi:hypothetical protein
LSLILFPFKAYTALAFITVFIWGSALPRHSQDTAVADAGLLIVAGYLFSGVALLFGGVIQSCIGQKESAIPSYFFGAAAFIIAFWLAPMFAFA